MILRILKATAIVVFTSICIFTLGIFVAQHIPLHSVGNSIPTLSTSTFSGPYATVGIRSEDFYNAAYDAVEFGQRLDAPSFLVAHHLIVGDKIAELFSWIGDKKTDTVIVLSPNHFEHGTAAVQTCTVGWQTPYGDLLPDAQMIDDLQQQLSFVTDEADTCFGEHGVGAITPFVKRSFPGANIVPVLLSESTSTEEINALAAFLADQKHSKVVASVDMSHTLPDEVADYHDMVTMQALETASVAIDLEVDSNASLRTLAAYNARIGAEQWHMTYHGSSVDMGLADTWEDNTSHILGYFTEGIAEASPWAALHFVGDIMLDRGTRLKLDAYGVQYPWEYMERYLSGSHAVIGNLEGTVNEQQSTYTYDPPFRFVFSLESVEETAQYVDVMSLANNHTLDVGWDGQEETMQRLTEMGIPWFGSYADPDPRYDVTINGIDIAIIGYHQFSPNEEALTAMITQADQEEKFVIVYPHWGTEYVYTPSASQERLATLMVEAGADLIIGGHPHVTQGMDVIDDVPVLYSLGNFVFDQQIPVTWPAMTVGVVITDESVILSLLPVWAQDSQPKPIDAEQAEALLLQVANASPEQYREQILNAVITIPYAK